MKAFSSLLHSETLKAMAKAAKKGFSVLFCVFQSETVCMYLAGAGSAAQVPTEEAELVAGVVAAPDPAAEVGTDEPAQTFLTWTMASTKRTSRRWVYAASAPHAFFIGGPI